MTGTLHPNLAKIAAAYDDVLRRRAAHQISDAAARAEVDQLEARDDHGVRWSIDPDTGGWLRKNAFGDLEYDDQPPQDGVMTADAFTYTPRPTVFNPGDVLMLKERSRDERRLPLARQQAPARGRVQARTLALAVLLLCAAVLGYRAITSDGVPTAPPAPVQVMQPDMPSGS